MRTLESTPLLAMALLNYLFHPSMAKALPAVIAATPAFRVVRTAVINKVHAIIGTPSANDPLPFGSMTYPDLLARLDAKDRKVLAPIAWEFRNLLRKGCARPYGAAELCRRSGTQTLYVLSPGVPTRDVGRKGVGQVRHEGAALKVICAVAARVVSPGQGGEILAGVQAWAQGGLDAEPLVRVRCVPGSTDVELRRGSHGDREILERWAVSRERICPVALLPTLAAVIEAQAAKPVRAKKTVHAVPVAPGAGVAETEAIEPQEPVQSRDQAEDQGNTGFAPEAEKPVQPAIAADPAWQPFDLEVEFAMGLAKTAATTEFEADDLTERYVAEFLVMDPEARLGRFNTQLRALAAAWYHVAVRQPTKAAEEARKSRQAALDLAMEQGLTLSDIQAYLAEKKRNQGH
jgi:hypothetical protein